MKTDVEKNGSTFPFVTKETMKQLNEVFRPLVGRIPAGLREGRRYSVAVVLGDTLIDGENVRIVISDLKKGELFAIWSDKLGCWVSCSNLRPLEFEPVTL